MESPQEIVKRLREAGWSQQQIADAVGVSQTTICRVEWSGKKEEERGGPMIHRYDLVDKLRALAENHADLAPEFENSKFENSKFENSKFENSKFEQETT